MERKYIGSRGSKFCKHWTFLSNMDDQHLKQYFEVICISYVIVLSLLISFIAINDDSLGHTIQFIMPDFFYIATFELYFTLATALFVWFLWCIVYSKYKKGVESEIQDNEQLRLIVRCRDAMDTLMIINFMVFLFFVLECLTAAVMQYSTEPTISLLVLTTFKMFFVVVSMYMALNIGVLHRFENGKRNICSFQALLKSLLFVYTLIIEALVVIELVLFNS